MENKKEDFSVFWRLLFWNIILFIVSIILIGYSQALVYFIGGFFYLMVLCVIISLSLGALYVQFFEKEEKFNITLTHFFWSFFPGTLLGISLWWFLGTNYLSNTHLNKSLNITFIVFQIILGCAISFIFWKLNKFIVENF